LIAEAAWPEDGLPIAGIQTGAGTEVPSNAETFLEKDVKISSSVSIQPLNKNRCLISNPVNIIFLNNNPEVSKKPMFPNNQRASQRFAYEASIKIENCDSGTYTYGRMYNYSAGGIYFESDVEFQPGTQVRIDSAKPGGGLFTENLTAKVKWCREISAAVVLYDYGIGVEFDRLMNRLNRNGTFKVIQGGAYQQRA
jgi:hypothetical protein